MILTQKLLKEPLKKISRRSKNTNLCDIMRLNNVDNAEISRRLAIHR